jgi:hypothetical protein
MVNPIDWNFIEYRAMMLTAFAARSISRSNLNLLRRTFQNFDTTTSERCIRFFAAIGRSYVEVIEDGAPIDNLLYYLGADGTTKAYTKDLYHWTA